MNEITDSNGDAEAEISKYVRNNREMISRILAHGDAEARGYALALLAEGGEVSDIDAVQETLEEIRQQKVSS